MPNGLLGGRVLWCWTPDLRARCLLWQVVGLPWVMHCVFMLVTLFLSSEKRSSAASGRARFLFRDVIACPSRFHDGCMNRRKMIRNEYTRTTDDYAFVHRLLESRRLPLRELVFPRRYLVESYVLFRLPGPRNWIEESSVLVLL